MTDTITITIPKPPGTRVRVPMDPALKKLLDELPREDPDKPFAIIWTPWTQGEHKIPLNEWASVQFGEWYGPDMDINEVRVYALVAGHTAWANARPSAADRTIKPGNILSCDVRIGT